MLFGDIKHQRSISKNVLSKGQKIVRLNKYFMEELSKNTRFNNVSVVDITNEDELDSISLFLGDLDYYWIFYRLNFDRIDFLHISKYNTYTLEIDYNKISDSVI